MYTKNFVAQSVPTLLNLEYYQVKSIRSKGAQSDDFSVTQDYLVAFFSYDIKS